MKPTALDQITEEPPGHLPVSAGVAYRETASALNTLGIGSQADTGLIESYAMALGLFRDASAQIAAEGLVIEDRDGNVRKHPLLATVNQTSTQIKNLGSRLGLDPVTRAGLEIERPPAGGGDSLADKWGHYLND